jgi:hypothetical protein
MRIIAFITDAPTVCDILAHLGEFTAPTRIAPARVPTLSFAHDRACQSRLLHQVGHRRLLGDDSLANACIRVAFPHQKVADINAGNWAKIKKQLDAGKKQSVATRSPVA